MLKITTENRIDFITNYITRIGDMADYPEQNFMPNEYICYYSEQVERLCQLHDLLNIEQKK